MIDPTLQHMFTLALPVLEKIARPVVVYAALIILLRLFGKRELAQLNPFDLVVLLCLSNTVQNSIIGEDNSVTGGLIGAASLLAINFVTVRLVLRHRRLDQIFESKPTVLIEHGRVQHNALGREMMSESELAIAVQRQGYGELDQIESCVLQSNGTFTIAKKDTPEVQRNETLERLNAIQQQLDQIRITLTR